MWAIRSREGFPGFFITFRLTTPNAILVSPNVLLESRHKYKWMESLRRTWKPYFSRHSPLIYLNLQQINFDRKTLEHLKIDNNFDDCHWQEIPYVMRRQGNASAPVRFEGFCIDLLNAIAKELGFSYELYLVPDKRFGAQNVTTGEWNGLVKELILKVRYHWPFVHSTIVLLNRAETLKNCRSLVPRLLLILSL